MISSFARRLLMPLMAVFAMLTLSPLAASAATPWVPEFNAGQTVYIDPALANDAQYPVRLDGLDSKLQALSSKQGVHFFFVYEKSIPDAVVPSQYHNLYAEWQLDDIANRWAGKTGYSSKDSVVILLVRSAKNPNAFSYAADSGSQWQQAGLTKAYYTDSLKSVRKTYLPNDPASFATAAADDSNSHIGSVKAEAASVAAHKAFVSHLPIYIAIVLIVLGLAGYGIFLFVRLGKAKKLLADVLADLQPKFDSFNTITMKLSGSYMGFLSDQKGWKGRFTGTTQTKYATAVAAYSDLTIRRQIAQDLLNAGQKALEAGSLFSVGGLTTAYANLTSTPVVITGEEIEFKNITDAFGGLVSKVTLTPEQLFANLNDSFKSCNSLLSEIYGAFESASANKTAIETTLSGITDLQSEIEGVGLSFVPYTPAAEALKTRAATTVAGIDSDPVSAVSGSTSLRNDAEKLKASIEQAVALKKDVLTVGKQVDDARSEIATKRSQTVVFAFTPAAPPATFLFNEGGYNPDDSLARADASLKTFGDALGAGKVGDAEAAKVATLAAVATALGVVTAALAAKKSVEDRAPGMSAKFANYGAFTEVAAAYADQAFVSAESILDALDSLSELEQEGATLASSASKNAKLSDLTESKVSALAGRIDAVVAAYKAPSFDGARAQALHDAVAAEFTAAQEAIAADERSYQSAADAVGAFRSAVNQATSKVNDNRVGQGRRDSLTGLNETLSSLTSAVQFTSGAKSNWASVETQADSGKAQADALKAAAQADIDAAVADAAALAELQDAEQELTGYTGRRYVRTINSYSFGGGILFNSSVPMSHLSLAQQYYHQRNYSAMRDAISEMQESAYQADTYAWWLTMELMAESNNVMAQRYAYELGYRDGVTYDSWYDNRIGSGVDYNQPWEPIPDTSWQPSRESAHIDPDYVDPSTQYNSRRDDDDNNGTGNSGGNQDAGFGGFGGGGGNDRDDSPAPDYGSADTGNSGGGQDDNF